MSFHRVNALKLNFLEFLYNLLSSHNNLSLCIFEYIINYQHHALMNSQLHHFLIKNLAHGRVGIFTAR